MRKLRDNAGATLVELLITVAIGSLVTMAAVTVLIFGLKAHHLGLDTTARQNEIQMGISVIRELLAENTITGIGENGEIRIADGVKDGKVVQKNLLYYDAEADAVCGTAGGKLLEKVTGYSAAWNAEEDPNLLTVTVKLENGKEYSIPVYCRMVDILPEESTEPDGENTKPTEESKPEEPGEEENPSEPTQPDNLTPAEVLEEVLQDQTLQTSVRVFLNKLASQISSTGRIITEDGLGEYFSQWYIGSYEENPGWNEDTPWCGCFVSWALAGCGPYMEGEPPRFANVDTFWVDLVRTNSWKDNSPQSGDLVFFDYTADGISNPEHVGVVIAQRGDKLYTIEGNALGGIVTLRQYAVDDPDIMSYGILNWK